MPDSIEETMRSLSEHRPLTSKHTKALSGLASGQIALLRSTWFGLPDRERVGILAALIKQANENRLLDFDAVFLMAMDDPNASIRRVAVGASETSEKLDILEKLLSMASGDPDETVRSAAAERLGGFAYEAEVGRLHPGERDRIEQALLGRVRAETETWQVRAAALASAGFLSTESVRVEVRQALDDSSLRVSAIRAIARNLDPAWSPLLVEQMGSEDPVVRCEAAMASSEYEDTVDALGELVDDPDESVRLAAISSLGKIGSPDAHEFLVYCHESSDPVIRDAALQAMQAPDEDEESLADFSVFGQDEEEE
jgi:HEAT repeat protein